MANERKDVEVTAIYERDSKRYHLFTIQENDLGIVGSIYIQRDEPIPKSVKVTLMVKTPGE